MQRKICLMTVANDIMESLIPRLPVNVEVTGRQACFDRAATIIRLEGPGLPDWCAEPPNGEPYACVTPGFGDDGMIRFWLSSSVVSSGVTFYERVMESLENRN